MANDLSLMLATYINVVGIRRLGQSRRACSAPPPPHHTLLANISEIRISLLSMAKGKWEAAVALASIFANSKLQFCTGSTYAVNESCPAYSPIAGSGTCYNLSITSTKCCEDSLFFLRLGLFCSGILTDSYGVQILGQISLRLRAISSATSTALAYRTLWRAVVFSRMLHSRWSYGWCSMSS